MLSRITPRARFSRLTLRALGRARFLTRNSNPSPAGPNALRAAVATSGVSLAAYLLLSGNDPRVFADAAQDDRAAQDESLPELARSYLVYTICSFPWLVDLAPSALSALTSTPGLKQLTEAVVKKTFFAQFVGGESSTDCLPVLERLRSNNKGALFVYSAEVDEEEAAGMVTTDGKEKLAPHREVVQEVLRAITTAADFEDSRVSPTTPNARRTWVAVKLTAMVPNHETLIKLSKYLVDVAQTRPHDPPVAFPGCPRKGDLDILRTPQVPASYLSDSDVLDLIELYRNLRTICAHAQSRGIRLTLDAEHTWYQPAVDAMGVELMREFNKLPDSASAVRTAPVPLVYGTFQAYLCRTPEFLAQSLKDAKAGNYTLGVKLVRGAYHEQENNVHAIARSSQGEAPVKRVSPSISRDSLSPIWPSKEATDACYALCTRLVLDQIREDIRGSSSQVGLMGWLSYLWGQSNGRLPTVAVLFGTHNWDSCRLVLQRLADSGLARPVAYIASENQPEGYGLPDEPVLSIADDVADRVTLSQLYGMSDTLTDYISSRTRTSSPIVLKYLPYGGLSEVMPYLARRAVENKAVLGNGQAAIEKRQMLNVEKNTVAKPRRSFLTIRRVVVASGVTVAAFSLSSSGLLSEDVEAVDDHLTLEDRQNTMGELIRQYAVYAMCSSPTLIDWAPSILETLTSIPIIREITEAAVSQTFFLQFVGGPTTDECVPLLQRLRKVNMGVLFAYSVEVDEDKASGHKNGSEPKEALHKRIVKEMMHSIDVAGDFEDATAGTKVIPNRRRAWVAVKLTALVPDHISLVNFSKDLTVSAQNRPVPLRMAFPGCPRSGDLQALHVTSPGSDSYMTAADLAALTELHQDLRTICAHAQTRGVRIIIDAEYSWYQPAVDALTLALMREFNRLPSSEQEAAHLATPLVYNTFQAYLRRTPTYLAQSIQDARTGNYALGVKLVRGAYHEQENEAHEQLRTTGASHSISPDPFPPVWSSKLDTDASYNACARLLLDTIAQDIAVSRDLSETRWLPAFARQRRIKTPSIAVLFGSHNWDSIRDILGGLEEAGLAKPIGKFPAYEKPDGQLLPEDTVLELPDDVAERITIGQLYGMGNSLSNYIVARTRSSTPVVLKYIPYGSLAEVMPYLARRAIENKAVLGNGQAAIERRQAWREIRKRVGI
ncbi:unnamed protein product [Peniophora sp. CBMAI 1063]|nr:unnamed protein product [Peniophora sp. CBMAI 1063]